LNDGSSVGGRVLKRAAFRRRLLKPFRFFAIERAFCVEGARGLDAKKTSARVLDVAAASESWREFYLDAFQKRRRFARILLGRASKKDGGLREF